MKKSLVAGVRQMIGLNKRSMKNEARSAWGFARFAVVAVMAMVFGLAGFVSSAQAVVTLLDATLTAPTTNGGNSPTTHNYTAPAGTDRVVVVSVVHETNQGNVSGVTIGGTAATQLGTTYDSGNNHEIIAFYLPIGDSGSAQSMDVVATWSTSADRGHTVFAATYGGVNQDDSSVGSGFTVRSFGGNATEANGNLALTPDITNETGGKVVVLWTDNTAPPGDPTSGGTWTFANNSTSWAVTSNFAAFADSDSTAAGTATITVPISARGAAVAFALNEACVSTGSLSITSGQSLAGNPIDLTSISSVSNASNVVYTVTDGTPGAPFVELEYFDTIDSNCDYSSWTPSTAGNVTCGNPGTDANDGNIYVRSSGTSTNGGTLTGSANTGPTSLHSGDIGTTGGFIWREESGGPYTGTPEYFTRDTSFDADTYEPNISFAFSKWGADAGSLIFEVNTGSGWTAEWQHDGNDGNAGAWTEVDINLNAGTVSIDGAAAVSTSTQGGTGTAYTSGTIDFRFQWIGAADFEGDAAIDTIRVYGPARTTTYYDSSVDGPANSVDTTGWPSPSTLTLTITGDDATCSTPLTQAQDTFDYTACTPGTLTAPAGPTVSGNPLDICSNITLGGGAGPITNVTITEGPNLDDNFNDASVDAKWTKTDVGGDATPAPSESGGTLTLSGAGADIWDTADQFTFLSQQVSGDFDMQVYVPSHNNTAPVNAWFKAGLMVRPSLAADSRNVANLVTESNGVTFQDRPTDGTTSASQADAVGTTPKYLRITRTGDNFRAYWKNNFGDAWTENTGGLRTVVMGDPVYIGLAVTSHDVGNVDTATFDDFIVTGPSTTLYDGASCSGINTSGWTSGIKNVDVTASDGCSGTLNDTGTIDYNACTDGDLATLTTGTSPASPVSGTTTVYATVGTETAPATMGSMQVDIAGTTGGTCDVTGAAMTWSAGNSRWEYSWDTSACGDPVESGITIDVSGTDPDCSNPTINATQISVNIDNTCTETGTVSVSISPDPGAGDITGDTTVTANLGGGATNGMVRWRVNGGPWSLWAATGATFTPPAKDFGTVEFEAMADGSCGAGSPVFSTSITRNYDTRIDALEPQSIQEALQNGLTSIRVFFDYCNDKNNTGTFLVEYKLASSGTWLNAANMPTTDGGTGDNDGTLNEEIVVIIPGLDSSELYDIRITYIDSIDGVIGTDIYNLQVQMVAWTDDPLLHNALRFACDKAGYWDQTSCEGAGGTWTIDRKWATGWGTDSGEYGPIVCDTCHVKGATNIKKVSSTITAASGSFPGSAVSFTTVSDGVSDFGDDAGGHATSNKVCEVCHSQTDYHRYDTTGQAGGMGHYNQADCIKCHEHKIGFRASCNACHGNPPLAVNELTATLNPVNDTGSTTQGEHNAHVNTLGYNDCNTCHNGWEVNGEMPKNGNINIGFITPGTNVGTYDGRSTGGGYTAGTDATVTTGDGMTCAVYCHGYGTPQWNPTATADCGACHGEVGSFVDDRAGAPTGGTSLDLSGAASGFKVGKHANHLDDSIAETGDPCALCHDGFAYADATHVDGTVNINLHASAGVTAGFTPGSPGTCSNLDCHDDATWDSNASGGCTFCHGYPPTSASSHAAGVNPVNHDMYSATGVRDNHDDCTYCHGYKNNGSNVLLPLTALQITNLKGDPTIQPSLAGYHQDGSVTINANNTAPTGDNAGYNTTNGGCDNAACHANDASHRFTPANTGNYQPADIGPGSCSTCHDTGVGGAPVVTLSSSHTNIDRTTAATDCTDCHSGHYTSGSGAQIPNNGTVGISYTASGHGGIMLGGDNTSTVHTSIRGLTTEAQICWACHDADGSVSEWGTDDNNDNFTDPGNNYNYGTLNTPNWTTATWTSGVAKFSFKTAAIQSTHAANGSGVSGVDAVGNIRCSYCHDVHDLNYQTDDAVSGAPYLRGTWLGNPYPEDGPPQTGDSWTTNIFGAVPRGTNAANELGGFQIDQNNGNPTNGWTANSSAGLCELCHGNGDGNFTAAEIDTLNQFGTASTDWVGTNGHSAAVLGGGDSVAANIFSINDRNVSPPTFVNDDADRNNSESNPAMAYQQISTGNTGNRAYGFRSSSSEPDGWNLAPRTTNDRAHDSYNWGANTQNGLDSNYHNFSCSKCHNPHASRLPRLMITNCLDTKQNTWDNGQPSIPNQGTNNNDGAGSINAENANVKYSNTTSAMNCHRVKDPAFSNSRGTGWNYVTPWGSSR